MAFFKFDATTVDPQDSFEVIPAGSYIAKIEESEIKATKSGTGQMLKAKYRIIDGQYANRVLWGQINVVNKNPEAEKIGQRQLSALCHAVGVLQLQDTQQLHGKPIKVKVKIKKDETGRYDDQNEITGWEAVSGGQVDVVSPSAHAAPPPPASAAPWAKKVS